MQFAIDYVSGYNTRALVVDAPDADDAYDVARSTLRSRGLYSASLQGKCRTATQADIDAAERVEP